MEERNYLSSIDYVASERNITQYFCNLFFDNFETADSMHFIDYYAIKIQRIGKTILTGDEEWFFDKETQSYYYYQFNKFCNDITGLYDKMLCTHFRWVKKNDKLNYGEFCGDLDNKIMFKFDNNENIDNFKKWLRVQFEKSRPVEVYYILQYPEISFVGNNFNPNPRFKKCHSEIISSNRVIPKKSSVSYLNFDELIK